MKKGRVFRLSLVGWAVGFLAEFVAGAQWKEREVWLRGQVALLAPERHSL